MIALSVCSSVGHDVADERVQPGRGEDRREREDTGQPGRDERAERDEQDPSVSGRDVRLGPVHVTARIAGRARGSQTPDRTPRRSSSDCRPGRRSTAARIGAIFSFAVVGLAPDVELDERRVPVGRDEARARLVERRDDVRDDGLQRERLHDVGDGRRGTSGWSTVVVRDWTSTLSRAGDVEVLLVENLLGAARVAVRDRPRLHLLGARRRCRAPPRPRRTGSSRTPRASSARRSSGPRFPRDSCACRPPRTLSRPRYDGAGSLQSPETTNGAAGFAEDSHAASRPYFPATIARTVADAVANRTQQHWVTGSSHPGRCTMKVSDVMTRDVITVPRSASLKEAASVLVQRGISGVPVVDDGKVVGVFSERDLLFKEQGKPDATHWLDVVDRPAGGRRPAEARGPHGRRGNDCAGRHGRGRRERSRPLRA